MDEASANGYGEFITTFNSHNYWSFIDSGSNGLFFPAPSSGALPSCTGLYSDWFCPSTLTTLSATNKGAAGSPSGSVSFSIANSTTLFSSSNYVFNDLGGNAAGMFDWGLPFFLGRDVYVGIDGKSSGVGTGPYWAY